MRISYPSVQGTPKILKIFVGVPSKIKKKGVFPGAKKGFCIRHEVAPGVVPLSGAQPKPLSGGGKPLLGARKKTPRFFIILDGTTKKIFIFLCVPLSQSYEKAGLLSGISSNGCYMFCAIFSSLV